jgi:hypothetical protein
MAKEFVPYEQALSLKELGFDEPCFANWIERDIRDGGGIVLEMWSDEDTEYTPMSMLLAPLYQQAFRWFREKHNLFNRPDFDVEYIDELDEFQTTYFFSILKMEESLIGFKPLGRLNNEKTYEEAELECLKKLIEIVKEK